MMPSQCRSASRPRYRQRGPVAVFNSSPLEPSPSPNGGKRRRGEGNYPSPPSSAGTLPPNGPKRLRRGSEVLPSQQPNLQPGDTRTFQGVHVQRQSKRLERSDRCERLERSGLSERPEQIRRRDNQFWENAKEHFDGDFYFTIDRAGNRHEALRPERNNERYTSPSPVRVINRGPPPSTPAQRTQREFHNLATNLFHDGVVDMEDITTSLHSTMGNYALAKEVLLSFNRDLGIPEDVPGIWTKSDDICLDSRKPKKRKQMLKKHQKTGNPRCIEMRRQFLRTWNAGVEIDDEDTLASDGG